MTIRIRPEAKHDISDELGEVSIDRSDDLCHVDYICVYLTRLAIGVQIDRYRVGTEYHYYVLCCPMFPPHPSTHPGIHSVDLPALPPPPLPARHNQTKARLSSRTSPPPRRKAKPKPFSKSRNKAFAPSSPVFAVRRQSSDRCNHTLDSSTHLYLLIPNSLHTGIILCDFSSCAIRQIVVACQSGSTVVAKPWKPKSQLSTRAEA